jgi:hypothetical protein
MHLPAAHSTDTRDLRLDLFRGIANWAIFVDHIPNNVVSWLTIRNYGFSDAADLFVFISGYAASLICAKIMAERGFGIAAARIMKRVWKIYAAHVLLLVAYIAVAGYIAQHYDTLDLANEFNIAGLIWNPVDTLTQGLLLRFKPLNLDVLPLYVVLMTFLPPVIWLMLRAPDLAMGASLLVYLAARHFGWNLSAYPTGAWYFNPFAWQLLFVFGSWFVIGGARKARRVIRSRSLLYFGTAYLIFSLAMTMAGRFPEFADIFPGWLVEAFNPNDKTNLAPYRVVHFVIIVLLVARFVHRDWRGLKSKLLQPVIACGQQSLKVFCVGLFLSFGAHFVLEIGSGAVWLQMLVSAVGLSLLSAVAYLACWFKGIEKPQVDLAPKLDEAAPAAPGGHSYHTGERDFPASNLWLKLVHRPFPEVPRFSRNHASGYPLRP